MAVPTSIDDLSATAASNGPDGGTDLPSAYDDYIRAVSAFIRQIRDGKEFPALLTSVSGADTITASAPASVTAYATGQVFRFVSVGANTGAVTLNINSIGAKSITKNGATALVAADIPSGAVVVVVYDGTQFQLVGAQTVAAATSRSQYALASQVQDSTLTYLTSVSGTDTLTATAALSMSAYATGQMFHFLAAGDNTGAVTLNINSIGAKSVVLSNGDALSSGEIATGQPYIVIYDGTDFRLTGDAQSVSGTAVDLSSGSPTSATFSVPSWAKKITISMIGISLTGTDIPVIRLGTSGGIETTGYTGGVVSGSSGSSPTSSNNSTYFKLKDSSLAAQSWDGTATLVNNGGNRWSFSCVGHNATAVWSSAAGSKTLSDALTQIQFLRAGSDTFDAGYVNVLCE